ncbi:hypothetical protein D3C86_1753030 [compost metagenome]
MSGITKVSFIPSPFGENPSGTKKVSGTVLQSVKSGITERLSEERQPVVVSKSNP